MGAGILLSFLILSRVALGDTEKKKAKRTRKRDAAFLLTVRSFLLTVELLYLQLTIFAFLLTILVFFADNLSFFAYSLSFCTYNGKVHLIRALRDCKQRSLSEKSSCP